MTKPALVIFDLDGTLMNTLGDITKCVNETLAAYGYPTHPSAQPFINNGARRLIADALPEHARDDETVDKVLSDYRKAYSATTHSLTFPYDGVVDVLKALKKEGIKTALFSNKDTPNCLFLVNRDFPELLDCVVGVETGIPPKPDLSGIAKIFKETGCNAENTIYVGDSNVDVLTAKNANLPMFGVSWGFSGNKPFIGQSHVHQVDTAAELLSCILQGCK